MTSNASPGVLETTRPVVEQARHVRIRPEGISALCDRWVAEGLSPPGWDADIHFGDGSSRSANYVLLLDALNFCFWSDPGEPRWEVEHRGRTYDGYKALSVALLRAMQEGVPVTSADYLSELTPEQLRHVLRPAAGSIPMFEQRLENAREVGRVLCQRWSGQFTTMVAAAGGSAPELVCLIERELPSFRDVATYAGRPVSILKRAQITVADLHGTFAGRGPGELRELDRLTAFADYKIPQILRTLEVLHYSPELAARVDARRLIEAGAPEEVEIRASMIWAVEELRQGLAQRGLNLMPHELDWHLWNEGQRPWPGEKPYHRTRTIFY